VRHRGGPSQRHGELRPFADPADDREITLHAAGEVAADGKPESRAFTRIAKRPVELNEWLEDLVEAIGRDSWSGVLDVCQHEIPCGFAP
jgi:hypothetical protein